jgi:hypothetical protein
MSMLMLHGAVAYRLVIPVNCTTGSSCCIVMRAWQGRPHRVNHVLCSLAVDPALRGMSNLACYVLHGSAFS